MKEKMKTNTKKNLKKFKYQPPKKRVESSKGKNMYQVNSKHKKLGWEYLHQINETLREGVSLETKKDIP